MLAWSTPSLGNPILYLPYELNLYDFLENEKNINVFYH